MGSLAAKRSEIGYRSFLTAASQMVARPLTQFYKEWRCTCVLTEWMDRTLRLGYSHNSVLRPFSSVNGGKGGGFISSGEDKFPLSSDPGHFKYKGCVCRPHARQKKGVLLHVLPGSQEDGRLQTHFGSPWRKLAYCLQTFCMLTMKQILELVPLGDWSTTINLCGDGTETQEIIAFCLPGDSLRVQQTTVRLFTGCLHLHQMCGSGAAAATQLWHEGLLLSRRPHCHGQVQSMGDVSHGPIDLAPHQVGVCDQLEEELEYLGVVLDACKLQATLSEHRRTAQLQVVGKLRRGVTVTIVMHQWCHWGCCTYNSCRGGLPAFAWIPRSTSDAWLPLPLRKRTIYATEGPHNTY